MKGATAKATRDIRHRTRKRKLGNRSPRGLKPRCITSALANMCARYTARSNEALIALAVRLQWIEIAIDTH